MKSLVLAVIILFITSFQYLQQKIKLEKYVTYILGSF